jgi:hypothetical protein
MTPAKINPLFRLMPSMTDVAFLLPLTFLFGGLDGVRSMLGDGDTGWHVRTGEWILAHAQVPHVDVFSYTNAGRPWFAWEWLWDVGFALLHQRWGLAGVVLMSLAVLCTASALLYRLAYRRCGNALVAIGLTGLAAAGGSMHWLARPHLFTLLFVVVFLHVLDRAREGRTRLLWLLPALMIPWTNLHGAFFVGILLVGCYAGGEAIQALVTRERAERIAALKRVLPYVWTMAGCGLASLVNPYFYHLQGHIFEYLLDPFQMKYIVEFQSVNFQNISSLYLEVMLLLGLGGAVWYGRRKHYTEMLMIVFWGHLALISVRNIPIFMIVAAAVTARPVVEWLGMLSAAPIANWLRAAPGTLKEIGEELNPLEGPWRVHAIPVAAIALIALGMSSPQAGTKFKPRYDAKSYPEAALGELRRPGQRIFTHDEWGDYLLYQLSPQGTKVFVDGRSDFYGGKFEQEYMDVMNVKYDWQQTLDKYGVDTILLPVDAPLAGAVKETKRWRAIYDDGRAIVFRRASERPGGMEQFSTSSTGGIGGRGFEITAASNVNRKDHAFQTQE